MGHQQHHQCLVYTPFATTTQQPQVVHIRATNNDDLDGRLFLLSQVLKQIIPKSSLSCGIQQPQEVEQSEKKMQKLKKMAYLTCQGKVLDSSLSIREFLALRRRSYYHQEEEDPTTNTTTFLHLQFRLLGGMVDRQNRVGSKFGGGGVSSSAQSERERKERLKQLALESIDLAKDPYLVKNHLGSYECKLCLTLHRDESNYLAHTQGKKHQAGLARRAHLEKLKAEKEGTTTSDAVANQQQAAIATRQQQQMIKIGRPAYQVYKSRDPETNQRCLSFEIYVPEISSGIQPRHRFMSSYEQKVDLPHNGQYQYLLLAAEPYETIAFKIPNEPIDKGMDKFVTHWDDKNKKFNLTLHFLEPTTNTTTTTS